MQHKQRDSRGRFAKNPSSKTAARITGLALIVLVLLSHLWDSNNKTERQLDNLRQHHLELLNRYSALEHEAAINSNPSEASLREWVNQQEKKQVHHATATAYSCNGIASEAQRRMNCPYGIARWTEQAPVVGRTIACPVHMKMWRIHIHGVGERVCEDIGGAITEGRLDLYTKSIATAFAWGEREVSYTIIHKQ